jgi:hypothetical protein
MKKITHKQLEGIVREAVRSKLSESKEDPTSAYAKKVDKFISSTIEGAKKLVQEGEEEIMPPEGRSFDKDLAERNRFTLTRVGFLKKLVSGLATSWELLKRDLV